MTTESKTEILDEYTIKRSNMVMPKMCSASCSTAVGERMTEERHGPYCPNHPFADKDFEKWGKWYVRKINFE